MMMPTGPDPQDPTLDAILSEPAFAALRQAGTPVAILAGRPFRVIFASEPARRLIPAATALSELADHILVRGPDGPLALSLVLASTDLGKPLLLPADDPQRGMLLARPSASTPGAVMVAWLGARVPLAENAPAEVVPDTLVSSACDEPTVADATTADQAPAAIASPRDRLAERCPGLAPFRFVWQVDAEGNVTRIDAALSHLAGTSPDAVIGRRFADLAGDGTAGALAQALAARTTFGGVKVSWPIAGLGAEATVPVTLGGAAVQARGVFAGFRGFGLARPADADVGDIEPEAVGDDAESLPPTVSPIATDDAAEVTPETHEIPETALTPGPPQEPAPEASESPARDGNVVPLAAYRPQTMPSDAAPSPDTSLSTDEAQAFDELRRVLEAVPAPTQQGSSGEAAARSGDPVAAILDRLPLGVLISRFEIPIYANRFVLEQLGYRNVGDLHAAGGLDRLFAGPPQGTGAPSVPAHAVPLVSASGTILPAQVRMQTVEWQSEPATLITIMPPDADIADRLATAEVERDRGERERQDLRAILDTATDGVAVLDGNGRILSLNRSGEALFGYDQKEVAGESFTFLLARDSHAAAHDYLAQLKSSGVASLMNDGRDVLGRARQGGSIPLFMTLGRIGQAGDDKFCAVLRDVTAWKRAEQELQTARQDAERTSAAKSDFLAKVSHEVRTPLNAIIGFAEVIMDERFGPIGNDRYRDYLKDIHASGTHVMSLVNDLLDLSKIEAGKLELDLARVDVNRVVNECVSLMQPQASRERVIVRVSLAPRLADVMADERSLRQIALNLLSNAIKFNEPGGQVIVSTAMIEGGQAALRIRDTGVGMSEDDVVTALEPFRQVATSRPHGVNGTGLGLPLTKALAEANHAAFSIRSKKNEGTLVEVVFPPARAMAAEAG